MRGYLYVIASALLYGSLAVVSKLVYKQGLEPFTLIVIMVSVASLFMWFIVLVTRTNSWRLDPKVIRPVLVQAIAGNFINSLSFFVALNYIDASIAILILYTSPAFVLLLELFIDKKHLYKRHLVSLIMCLLGLITVINPFPVSKFTINAFGISLAIAGSLSLAFGNWIGEKNMERSSPFAVMIWTTTIQGILFILISPISLYRGITAPIAMLGGIVILTIFTWVIPYFLILKGIEAIGASRASLISSLEIVFTLALAFLLLNERLSPLQAFGAALVIGAVFVLPRGSKEALPPQALS